jgi:hypothetical protein
VKRATLLFSLLVVCSVLYAARQKTPSQARSIVEHNGFLKAQQYLELSPEGQRAYIMGLLDGWYMAPVFGAPEADKGLTEIERCVEGMKSSQVAAIVDKYIRDRPEKWDYDVKDMGYAAVSQACGKR